jgi:hypothetical protein
MHCLLRLIGRQKHIALHMFNRALWNQETVAVSMQNDFSGEVFGIVANSNEVPRPQLNQFAAAAQALQGALEFVPIIAGSAKFLDELFVCSPRMRQFADVRKQVFVTESTRHKVIIEVTASKPRKLEFQEKEEAWS